jgi:hypothetical protein
MTGPPPGWYTDPAVTVSAGGTAPVGPTAASNRRPCRVGDGPGSKGGGHQQRTYTLHSVPVAAGLNPGSGTCMWRGSVGTWNGS